MKFVETRCLNPEFLIARNYDGSTTIKHVYDVPALQALLDLMASDVRVNKYWFMSEEELLYNDYKLMNIPEDKDPVENIGEEI